MIPPTSGDNVDPQAANEGPETANDLTVSHEEQSVDWDELPGPLRGRIAELAAAALGGMRPGDVPMRLRPVMRFAAAKRAKLGQSDLLVAMRDSSVFRAAVLDWCRRKQPAALEQQQADPLGAATAAVLLNSVTAAHYVELIGHRVEHGKLREQHEAAVSRAERLTTDNERLRGELDEANRLARSAEQHNSSDADRLRNRLRQQGVRLKEQKDEVARLTAELERVVEEKDRELADLAAERDRDRARAADERARAERSDHEAATAQQSAREARRGDEVRLSLLLDTLEGSIAGLRRELGPTRRGQAGGGPLPAETVGGVRAHTAVTADVPDAAALDRLLALPAVHLVVDGYNVTKTGYPDIPLAEQRDRLAHQLAVLAARSGAEVTVVFDGANVVSVPRTGPRGVRVLFSEPDVQADDVIRDLVDAEPAGRQIVVATSDREVVTSVRRRGAYAVASATLLERVNPL
ncbi:Predicted RNA-binding protein containing a PIN domain [Actinopolyspora lacussalsi subsp. righensis]|uniref:Predicted RNA-binding protein containing a PIN domain n=1 Tax=Actinopolyspora righensis TaxID=995060 RepID=A0A1I7AWE2_9ACTN|nr:NYN domain-containing protein [Actinopolyspora righensis]SFT79238.1 Predicted RNA-binding protein containing a PIN domain [Actinopolyspora righensis]